VRLALPAAAAPAAAADYLMPRGGDHPPAPTGRQRPRLLAAPPTPLGTHAPSGAHCTSCSTLGLYLLFDSTAAAPLAATSCTCYTRWLHFIPPSRVGRDRLYYLLHNRAEAVCAHVFWRLGSTPHAGARDPARSSMHLLLLLLVFPQGRRKPVSQPHRGGWRSLRWELFKNHVYWRTPSRLPHWLDGSNRPNSQTWHQ